MFEFASDVSRFAQFLDLRLVNMFDILFALYIFIYLKTHHDVYSRHAVSKTQNIVHL